MRKENTPAIETERLLLRRFTEADADDMLLLYSDEAVNQFLPWFPMKSLAETERYLHNTIFPFYQKDTAYSYAISQKQDNRVIGYVHIHDIGGSNDLGYALRKEFWHTGLTTEACAAVIARLREVKFPFVTATHDIHNPYSGEVMKKLGMTYRYSYEENWQPKNSFVIFRMYQLNMNCADDFTYLDYWNSRSPHWVEEN